MSFCHPKKDFPSFGYGVSFGFKDIKIKNVAEQKNILTNFYYIILAQSSHTQVVRQYCW